MTPDEIAAQVIRDIFGFTEAYPALRTRIAAAIETERKMAEQTIKKWMELAIKRGQRLDELQNF